jgi:hypothetical protein
MAQEEVSPSFGRRPISLLARVRVSVGFDLGFFLGFSVGSFYGFFQSYNNASSVRRLIPLLALDRLLREVDRKISCGSKTIRARERERGEGARGYTFVPLRRGRCRRARHGRAALVLAVAEAATQVLAVAEVQVASTGSGSRRRHGRWPAMELPAAAAPPLDRLGLRCRWGGGGDEPRVVCRWPPPVFIAQRDGSPPAKNELERPRSGRG